MHLSACSEGTNAAMRRRHFVLHRIGADIRNQSAATLLPGFLARSRSITARQPVLSWARCLNMQAVIFGIFGISSLHRRNASPVHCACASELKAKLAVEEIAENEAAKARARVALRMVLVKALVMVGSCGPGGPVVCWCEHALERFRDAVRDVTQRSHSDRTHANHPLRY